MRAGGDRCAEMAPGWTRKAKWSEDWRHPARNRFSVELPEVRSGKSPSDVTEGHALDDITTLADPACGHQPQVEIQRGELPSTLPMFFSRDASAPYSKAGKRTPGH